MTEQDRTHALEIISWFAEASFNKYHKGTIEHGGHLPDKGGLLHEAENEVLDQAIYLRTIREQIGRALDLLAAGRVEDTMITLNHILHGTPADRLPE